MTEPGDREATATFARWMRFALWPVLVGGALHALATPIDVVLEGLFSPSDPETRARMADTSIRLAAWFGSDSTRIWAAYLGFNLSHGLGMVAFAGSHLLLIGTAPEVYVRSRYWLAFALAVTTALLVVSATCWFYVPTLLLAASLGCQLRARQILRSLRG